MSRALLSLDWLRVRRAEERNSMCGDEALPNRVLFTGAGGALGRAILPLLRGSAHGWRLVDRADTMPVAGFDDRHVADLGTDSASHIFRDVDAVVHFAAQSKPASAAVLRRNNVELVQWVLDNMVAAAVPRLVYASSMHVMGMYDRATTVRPDDVPKPDSPYGESKLNAERLIQAAADSHNLQALILRIGHAEANAAKAEPGNWLAIDDLVSLVRIGLVQHWRGAVVVHAVTPHRDDDLGQGLFSESTGMRWSTAPSYADAMSRVPQWYGTDEVAHLYRGGVFASGRADVNCSLTRQIADSSD